MIDNNSSTHYFFQIDKTSRPVIISSQYKATEIKNEMLDAHYLVLVMKGMCKIGSEALPEITLKEREFMLLPYGGSHQWTCYENSHILLFRIKITLKHNIDKILHVINHKTEKRKITSPILQINEVLENYLQGIILHLQRGIPNRANLYYAKIKELFFILEHYYTQQELLNLLSPVLNLDFVFARFVLSHFESVKNAKELVELSMYCETTFNRKFKEIFFTTPYKWLNQKKAVDIYEELRLTDKPFKVIAEKYNFNSLQQFNDYCVRNFKKTPGSVRKHRT